MHKVLATILFTISSLPVCAQFSAPIEKVTASGFRYSEIVVSVNVPQTSCFLGCKGNEEITLRGFLALPVGSGVKPPYKLFVRNHGSQDGGTHFPYPDFDVGIDRYVLPKGYAIFRPYRKGFSSGQLPRSEANAETYEPRSCNVGNQEGVASAVSDVKAFLKVLTSRDDLDMKNIITYGQSRGGVVALALAAENYPGVVGVLQTVGGWLSEATWGGAPCGASFNETLFREFGEKIKVPVLSLYGSIDKYYGVPHIKTLLSYLGKHAPADWMISEGDGHTVFLRDANARNAWEEKREKFFVLINKAQ